MLEEGEGKKKWNEPAWHPKLIVPLSPPVLFFFLNPARTFWEGIIFCSSVVELTLGIIFCLGPFWQRPKRANRIVVMTFTSPFKLVGKKQMAKCGWSWIKRKAHRAPVDLARQSDLSEWIQSCVSFIHFSLSRRVFISFSFKYKISGGPWSPSNWSIQTGIKICKRVLYNSSSSNLLLLFIFFSWCRHKSKAKKRKHLEKLKKKNFLFFSWPCVNFRFTCSRTVWIAL
jgi:hypothetical protein